MRFVSTLKSFLSTRERKSLFKDRVRFVSISLAYLTLKAEQHARFVPCLSFTRSLTCWEISVFVISITNPNSYKYAISYLIIIFMISSNPILRSIITLASVWLDPASDRFPIRTCSIVSRVVERHRQRGPASTNRRGYEFAIQIAEEISLSIYPPSLDLPHSVAGHSVNESRRSPLVRSTIPPLNSGRRTDSPPWDTSS